MEMAVGETEALRALATKLLFFFLSLTNQSSFQQFFFVLVVFHSEVRRSKNR